ncbi:MAG: hypothetical protein M3Z83_11265 [Actinomycetota bacterium]|nr:hypothetical protein [Actinomycetota bacterium]
MHPGSALPEQAALDAVLRLVHAAQPACGPVTVVAVDGPSGSGKTRLSLALGSRLDAPVLHLDDLYPGWDGLAVTPSLVTEQVLAPLASGEPAAYRRWDWVEDRWAETVSVPPTPLLVLDGCGSSVRPAGDRAAVRVWVEAERGVRFRRGIARDGDGYRPHWERWARQEEVLFVADRTRERADLVIDTTTW